MLYPPEQATLILDRVRELLQESERDDAKLHKIWMSLAYIRGMALAQDLMKSLGPTVQSGPFKGMKLVPEVMIGAFAPILLGAYEYELHPAIEQAVSAGYANIINIGCAYGYYSVGLALRIAGAEIHAFDIDEACQKKCATLAALNGVESRVHVGGLFKGEDFARYAGKKTLALVDIEGAELPLLDPALYPALAHMDLIVELHDTINPVISQTLTNRFAPTHDIKIIYNRPQSFDFTPFTAPGTYVDPFDSMLAGWESRGGATPWAVMKVKVS